MRRPFVTTSCALLVALAPATALAQDPPAQPAAQQQPAPKEPRVTFKADAGVLLFTVKPDQAATFEELITKVKDLLSKSEDPIRKQQLAGMKVFKSSEPGAGGNTLFILVADPAVKAAEYDPIMLLVEGLGKEYATPENQEMVKRLAAAFTGGSVNQLNLTHVAK